MASQKTSKNKETLILMMPAFNEERNIKKTILSWVPVMKEYPGSEILVVNDGSTDETAKVLKKLSSSYKFLNVVHKDHEGHGKTIVFGYKKTLLTKHKWVFQADSDGYLEPDDFCKLWGKRAHSRLILGQRVQRKDGFYRIVLSKLISLWILIIFGEYLKDPNIPFRLIDKNFLKNFLGKIPEGVFAPNIFLSILGAQGGHNLHQIPIRHRSYARTKSSLSLSKLFFASIRGFGELMKFKIDKLNLFTSSSD